MTNQLLLVFLGGGIASTARYLLSFWNGTFPFGILIANCLASAIAGFAIASSELHWVVVGICGGLSTFSTFAAQTYELWKSGKQPLAVLNTLLNLALPALSFFTAQFWL